MSTRKLIIAALLTGLVILIAGAIQFFQIAQSRHSPAPVPVTPVSTR